MTTPSADSELADLLLELRLEQSDRWDEGERISTEELLERLPQLKGDEEAVVELAYAEFYLRTARGETPAPAEYYARFPEQRARLERLFELHAVLESPAITSDDVLGTLYRLYRVPVLRAKIDDREFLRRDVAERPMTLGRDSECDFVLDAPAVSRRHARVWLEGHHVWLEDLRSTNGTFVNGKPVQRCRLDPGDRIRIGRVRLKLEYQKREDAVATSGS
ncbi:MAG: FHA domain-containing protein [Planctomycetes bacterium]|nr:FHA domain-containing protein [Planctomycetota bacterium]